MWNHRKLKTVFSYFIYCNWRSKNIWDVWLATSVSFHVYILLSIAIYVLTCVEQTMITLTKHVRETEGAIKNGQSRETRHRTKTNKTKVFKCLVACCDVPTDLFCFVFRVGWGRGGGAKFINVIWIIFSNWCPTRLPYHSMFVSFISSTTGTTWFSGIRNS